MKHSNLLIAICISIPIVACGKDDANEREPADGVGSTGGSIPESGGSGAGDGTGAHNGGTGAHDNPGGAGGTGNGGNDGDGDGGSGGTGSGGSGCIQDGDWAKCYYEKKGSCGQCNQCYCANACEAIFYDGSDGEDAFDCTEGCGFNQTCIANCWITHHEAAMRYADWHECLQENCSDKCVFLPCPFNLPEPEGKACNECFYVECFDECNATNGFALNALSQCYINCGSDHDCADACADGPEAEAAYAFNQCMFSKCWDECVY
ncbi:MAG: hypothetical protein FWD57_08330 [Polyangiaceae bacterium]|nr:hypothetical protein [Polyangiaceae bacterium]